jgi:ATP-dependent helicase/nuclease subunit A
MPVHPFQIYKSSAGSGKTHQLTLEYLKLALQHVDAFKYILGVTFTNKATSEMKSRILEVLEALSLGKKEVMSKDLKATLHFTDKELKIRSKEVLSAILHQYGRFSIVTIDSFFHQVIRSFAQEMSLQGSFSIDLNTALVLRKVIDNLLANIGNPEHLELKKWLTQFAESKVEEGGRWDFRQDVEKLANQLTTDKFKSNEALILKLSDNPNYFPGIKKQLVDFIKLFKTDCLRLATLGADCLAEKGGFEVFKGKANGPAGLFKKIANKEFEVSTTRREACGNIDAWLTKENLNNAELVHFLQHKLLPIYDQLVGFIDNNEVQYQSIMETNRYLYTFGILSKRNQELVKYREEHDLVLIADLPDFLNKIISDSDTPYIYEKVGARYHHYLIDEFQDTSAFQWGNFKPLIKNGTDQGQFSMVVGDIKQSIYRWRGGDWRLLKDKITYDIGTAATKENNLVVNYRSGLDIVEFNNSIFTRMPEIAQTYFSDLLPVHEGVVMDALEAYKGVAQESHLKEKESAVCIEYLTADDENSWKQLAIQKTITQVEQLQIKQYQLRDIAILVRTKEEGKLIADGFMTYKVSENARPGFKYDVVSSEALFLSNSNAVHLVINLIKWVHQTNDRISLWEWFSTYWVIKKKGSKEEAFKKVDSWQSFFSRDFLRTLKYWRTLAIYELVESIIDHLALNELPDEFTYLQGLQDAVLDFTKKERGDIASFLIWWDEERKQRAIKIADENDAVKVLTIHKSKGLQYPIVIIPFLNWKLDNDRNEGIMWVDGSPLKGIAEIPIVPVKYSKNLLKTYWSEVYALEHINTFIDNMNVLYVAFTRPINGLFAFGETKKSTDINNIGEFVKRLLISQPHWEETIQKYNIGNLPDRKTVNNVRNELALSSYPSTSWRGFAKLQIKGSSLMNDQQVLDPRQWGISLHQALNQFHRLGDQYQVKDLEIKRLLKLIIHHEEVEPFFNNPEEVISEQPILLPGGVVKRIDRLIKKNGAWMVIDFKTGRPRETDQIQLREYVDILLKMGFHDLKGYLIYLDPIKVEAI